MDVFLRPFLLEKNASMVDESLYLQFPYDMACINPKIHKSTVATTKRGRDYKGKETFTASKDLQASQTSGCNSVILEHGSQFQAAFAAKAQAIHSSVRRCCGARNSLAPEDEAEDPSCCLACT